jgi:phosphocarrier protein
MISEKVTITNPSGLHLRPAGLLCKEALQFKSIIMIQKNGSMSNAKSVLSVLGACVKNGDQVTIACEGPDEEAALAHIVELIRSGLGE